MIGKKVAIYRVKYMINVLTASQGTILPQQEPKKSQHLYPFNLTKNLHYQQKLKLNQVFCPNRLSSVHSDVAEILFLQATAYTYLGNVAEA